MLRKSDEVAVLDGNSFERKFYRKVDTRSDTHRSFWSLTLASIVFRGGITADATLLLQNPTQTQLRSRARDLPT